MSLGEARTIAQLADALDLAGVPYSNVLQLHRDRITEARRIMDAHTEAAFVGCPKCDGPGDLSRECISKFCVRCHLERRCRCRS